MMNKTDIALFAAMKPIEIAVVEDVLKLKRYKKGSVIFNKDEEGDEMFIVCDGRVASVLIDNDGMRRTVFEYGPGRFFGEMSIIENMARSASCVALENSKLYSISKKDFFMLIREHPVIGSKMLSVIAHIMAGWLDDASVFLGDLARWGEAARKRSVTDELTGLFNRRFIDESSTAYFTQHAKTVPPCACMMLDIDHFHAINETYGTTIGDWVIAHAGKAYGAVMREGDIAARLAGDEFAFFLPDTHLRDAMHIAERICDVTRNLELIPEGGSAPIAISASIGVAAYPDSAADVKALFEAADKALFQAKEQGRNRAACLLV